MWRRPISRHTWRAWGGTAKFSCIGKCIRKCPELTDKVHGKIDGQHMVCDTKDAFYAEIRKALA